MQKEQLITSLVAIVVGGAVAVTGMVIGGKETVTTIDTSKVIERVSDTPDGVVSEYQKWDEDLGGLVNIFQEYFPSGLIIGNRPYPDYWQLVTDSSNNLYIGTSTDDYAIKIAEESGDISFGKSITFETTTLNYGGNFAVDTSDFFVDATNDNVGIGTTSPDSMLEIEGASGGGVASNPPNIKLTQATSTDTDFGIKFEDQWTTVGWIFYDDSADLLVISTSTDRNLLTFSTDGRIVALKGISMASGTVTGAFSAGTGTRFNGTVDILGETQAQRVIPGGTVTTVYGTTTLTAAQFCNSSVIQVGYATASDFNVTFPATTTLNADCLEANGKSLTFLMENICTSTGEFWLVAGSGIDLQGTPTSTASKTLNSDDSAEVTCWRRTSATTTCNVVKFSDLD